MITKPSRDTLGHNINILGHDQNTSEYLSSQYLIPIFDPNTSQARLSEVPVDTILVFPLLAAEYDFS